MPCGLLGANAAWLRLAMMMHNVLTALKRLALPERRLAARPSSQISPGISEDSRTATLVRIPLTVSAPSFLGGLAANWRCVSAAPPMGSSGVRAQRMRCQGLQPDRSK
jgi:hypothetical protein